MNMLFNTEKPRFDSHLQSARLRPQRAADASESLATATQQPESGVGCPLTLQVRHNTEN